MFKLVGLGALLALMFMCCCSMGTFLPDMLGANGPTSFQDLLEQAGDSGAGEPDDEESVPMFGDSPAPTKPGGLLPGVSDLFGGGEIDLSKMGEIRDIPIYPGAQLASDKVKIPMALSLMAGEWQKGMDELEAKGGGYAVYLTPAAPSAVVDWYKSQMPAQGWAEGMTAAVAEGGLLVYSKEMEENVSGVLLIFKDEGSGESVIFMIRGVD